MKITDMDPATLRAVAAYLIRLEQVERDTATNLPSFADGHELVADNFKDAADTFVEWAKYARRTQKKGS